MSMDLHHRLENEIHVWMCAPDSITDPELLSAYASLLSGEERERLQRFHFEKDRHSFLVSHALVRKALSRYANIDPVDWQFSAGEQGRPELVAMAGVPQIHFNLTHTHGLSACVISREISCGIDAERVSLRGDPLAVAEKMFAAAELADLKAQGGEGYLERFYVYWTLREAYCKAQGVGLMQSRNSYAFVAAPDGSYRLDARSQREAAEAGWCFDVSRPTTEHIVSVAYQSADCAELDIVFEFTTP